MALPLPRVVADVEAGGPFVTAARGLNALKQAQLQNQISSIEAQYKPLTARADAASKLAYANLMGPQFLAKMLGNSDIAANLSDPQIKSGIDTAYRAASGQGSGASIFGNIPDVGSNQNPFMELLTKGFNYLTGNGNPSSRNQLVRQPQQTSSLQDIQPAQNITPAMKNNGIPQALPPRTTPNPNIAVDSNGNVVLKDEGFPETYTERAARLRSRKEEGAKGGEIRAKAIEDFGNQVESGLMINDKYKTFIELVNDPEFRAMRENIPFFQDKQLNVLSKIGTPAQKEMIGRFSSAANEIMGDIIRSFGAQKFRGESDIARNMKINENDAFNVIVGKLQSGMLYKTLQTERANIASDIMEREHVTKREAIERADNQIDGEKIRKSIETKLDYPVQIRRKRNDGSYEVITVPVSEARKRGIKNV